MPLILGSLAVLQAGLNRKAAAAWGLGPTVLLNASILCLLALAAWTLGFFSGKAQLSDFRWWYLLPGVCGFALVAGLPVSIQKIGALTTFLLLVTAQLVAGALWDLAAGNGALSWQKIVGAALALCGTWIATR